MVKFLVMDVDGTLTDGKIYMGDDGEAFKAFDIKDGYAVHTLLKENGIVPVVITARKSSMVEHRCKELGVKEIHQGIMNKLDCLKGILAKYSSDGTSYSLSDVAYIGDDLLDLQCMNPIREAGGIAGCPSNAVKDVLAACDFVAPHKGGEGAVRDFAEYLLSEGNRSISKTLERRCFEAAEYLFHLHGEALSLGRHDVDDGFFYNVIEYVTTGEDDKPFESHRKYVDVQLIFSGEEIMQVADARRLFVHGQYDEVNDVLLYRSSIIASSMVLRPGSVMILFPNDAHRSISIHNNPCKVRKVVGKVAVK